MPSAWSRAAGVVLPRSRAAAAGARDVRLQALRAFGRTHGWAVHGLFEDLTVRYPVAPLLGARSAQAELALTGTWAGCPAVVGSVLVQPHRTTTRRPHDLVVQFTLLDTGPTGTEFQASCTGGSAPQETVVGRGLTAALLQSLQESSARAWLRPGDEVASAQVSLAHARVLRGAAVPDLEPPLQVLAELASRIG